MQPTNHKSDDITPQLDEFKLVDTSTTE